MDPITQQTVLAAGGAAGGDPVYVDDVFSAYIYEGTGSAQTITNGIDLAGEGGMVLQKRRSSAGAWFSNNTENGANNFVYTNNTSGLGVGTSGSSFNSNGFTIGAENNLHNTGDDVASWTFRKAPGFFDVVTWTGSGYTRTIPHNLGSVPGMYIVKRTDYSDAWTVYHKDIDINKHIRLNEDTAERSQSMWNGTAPTSTVFTVGGGDSAVNALGGTYVAFLFAHDDASFGTDGDESIIKCGSYTGTGAEQFIDLGFEPQFLLIKRSNGTGDWKLFDNMRRWSDEAQTRLFPNTTGVDSVSSGDLTITSTGFREPGTTNAVTNIYMAIRRPHKPPEAGTEVFAAHTSSATNGTKITTGFPIDMQFARWSGANVYNNTAVNDRIRGVSANDAEKSITLITSRTDFETSGAANALGSEYWDNTGFRIHSYASGTASIYQSFRRAPGFFDVVAYNGASSSQTISHNLEAVPEIMIVKKRSNTDFWAVYHSALGATKNVRLNSTAVVNTSASFWNNTEPTSSVFTVGSGEGAVNESGQTYIAYLFATLPGISKVGSYPGTGNNIDVDCGFTTGARFVLIKRTDLEITTTNTSGWYVWDSTRGIVSGDDPYFRLNDGDDEVINRDWIDPLNAGFTVTSDAPLAINTSGGTYIFLAIA